MMFSFSLYSHPPAELMFDKILLLLFIFSMQVVMLYDIHEKLDQGFMKEKELDLSSHQGSNTWMESDDNWNPYQELLQVRDRMEQILNDSISRLHHNSNTTPFTQIAAIDFKNEANCKILIVK